MLNLLLAEFVINVSN